VKVSPRSSKNELSDMKSEPIRVKLTASPVEGEANQALIKVFARAVGVPRRDVEIVSGKRSRLKTVQILGLAVDEIVRRLESKL
jgi:uncharacterized protein (TIGR00251 family)